MAMSDVAQYFQFDRASSTLSLKEEMRVFLQEVDVNVIDSRSIVVSWVELQLPPFISRNMQAVNIQVSTNFMNQIPRRLRECHVDPNYGQFVIENLSPGPKRIDISFSLSVGPPGSGPTSPLCARTTVELAHSHIEVSLVYRAQICTVDVVLGTISSSQISAFCGL